MKYLLLSALCLSLSFSIVAQDQIVDNFVNKYKELEAVTHISLTGDLLKMVSEAADEEGERKLVSQLEAIRIISIEDVTAVDANDLSALKQAFQANDYEELIRVRDGKDLVHIYLVENKDNVIEQLVILVQEPEEFTIVSLSGEMYYEDLKHLDLDGNAGEMLQNLPDRGQPRP